ncbi:hypothetical protein [Salinimonas iocasae]|uniref:Uncharacterized protein n=1 Tax=Salinimonas iocasae TaxID=2572577 RepID=A0A5B7Y9U2_9ALTE|nr:hypothetical protein [Salinimonas iocasae]QCZ92404.1 hypothetical protein FBQ74_02425 [Salinimonas iocasae]
MPVIVSVAKTDAWERFNNQNSSSITHLEHIKGGSESCSIIPEILDVETVTHLTDSNDVLIAYEPLPILVQRYAGFEGINEVIKQWADTYTPLVDNFLLNRVKFLDIYNPQAYENAKWVDNINFLAQKTVSLSEQLVTENLISSSSYHLSILKFVESRKINKSKSRKYDIDGLSKEIIRVKDLEKDNLYLTWELEELHNLYKNKLELLQKDYNALTTQLLYVQEKYEELYLSFNNAPKNSIDIATLPPPEDKYQGWRIDRIVAAKLKKLRKFQSDVRLIKSSRFFNSEWYLLQNPDVAKAGKDAAEHYLKFGANEGRNPSDNFNGNKYLRLHPDVKAAGLNPLVHYLRFGRDEKRPLP